MDSKCAIDEAVETRTCRLEAHVLGRVGSIATVPFGGPNSVPSVSFMHGREAVLQPLIAITF